MKNIPIAFIVIVIFFPCTVLAQKGAEQNVQSSSAVIPEVRSLVIDANNIKTILYNTGSISGPGVISNVYDFTWNGLGYAYEIGLLAGAKVVSSVNPSDTIKFIIDGFGASTGSTADGDFSPNGTSKWGWLPTKKYSNPASTLIANNQDPATWPSSWTTWNGKYGDPIADLELVYEMTDSSDAEFPYYPFPADTMRRGLGLTTTARYYQFSHPNLEDVLFTFFEVRNISPKTLTNVVTGISGDPHIGGASDFADDTQNFDTLRQLFYSWEPDSFSGIPNLRPGYFGMTMLSTPMNKGISSYAALPYGGNNRPKNDPLMYNVLSEGSKITDLFYTPQFPNAGDYVLYMGTGFYTLLQNQVTNIEFAYLFAPDLNGVVQRLKTLHQEYKIRFTDQGNAISLLSPNPGTSISTNAVTIQWTTSPLDNDTTVSLYYSNTADEEWNLIAVNIPNSGAYQWNVSSLRDGIFYKVHIINSNNSGIAYDSTNGYFTLNKPGDAPPEIRMTSPRNLKVVTGALPVQWIAGDADGDNMSISIQFSDNGGLTYTPLHESANTGVFIFDTRKYSNTSSAKIKLVAVANGVSASAESQTFSVKNPYFALTDTTSLKHAAGGATGEVFPGVADSSQLTGQTYRITFDSVSGSLRYSLKNLTTNLMTLTNEPMTTATGTGTLADGMRIWFKNHTVGLDSLRSKFLSPVQNVSTVIKQPAAGSFYPAPADFLFTFGSMDTTANGNYVMPLDSAGMTNPTIKTVRLPFKVTMIDDNTPVQLLVREISSKGKSFRWDFGEEIIIITPEKFRKVSNNTHAGVVFTVSAGGSVPVIPPGSQFRLYTTRPFSPADVYDFTADVKYGQLTTRRGENTLPTEYVLEQNFPNPFNPETRIQFSLRDEAVTGLRIFDALGRSVRTLLNEHLRKGSHVVFWDGKSDAGEQVASGMYFYRLQSGPFTQTKKMLLLR